MSAFAERFFKTDDGRELFYRDYPGPSSRSAVVCLPGLQSNSRTFQYVAPRIAKSRRVLCLDPRGRGRSAYDTPKNYGLNREAVDTALLVRHAGLSRVIVLGISRGGLSGLVLAAKSRLVSGLILVDVGPEIAVGPMPRAANDVLPTTSFATWNDAAEALKASHGPWFPSMPEEKWRVWADGIYKEQDGRIVPDSDFELTNRAWRKSEAEKDSGRIDLWHLFRDLPPMPVLVIRGEHSDVLSEETVAKMRSLRPSVVAATVKGYGHRPFLDEPESEAALASFFHGAP
jgi:pimeloyl-ACP methyl ester carboxylesterase